MRRVQFDPAALRELRAAIDESKTKWGKKKARAFIASVRSKLGLYAEMPEAAPIFLERETIRRVDFRQPFFLIYTWDDDFLFVISMLPKVADPNRWEEILLDRSQP